MMNGIGEKNISRRRKPVFVVIICQAQVTKNIDVKSYKHNMFLATLANSISERL